MEAIWVKWFMVYGLWFMVGEPTKSASVFNKHPFYISVTEVNHNAKDKTLEISCKVFADDLEKTLKTNYKTELDITAEKDKARLDKLISDYFEKHLALVVDGKPAKLNYIGYENDKESEYCYFQIDNVPSVKKIDITNSIFHDFTADQINIMHVTVNGKRQSTKLNYPDKSASFSF